MQLLAMALLPALLCLSRSNSTVSLHTEVLQHMLDVLHLLVVAFPIIEIEDTMPCALKMLFSWLQLSSLMHTQTSAS